MNTNYTPSDMIAMSGAGNDGGWNGNGGGWLLWLIFLWLLVGNNGYGAGGQGAGAVGGNQLYPYMELSNAMNNGFSSISGQMCNGFANTNAAMASGFAAAESGETARQMASMNQMFGVQTAIMQGNNQLASQFADCCCENRLATANQTATLLAEHCADRNALQLATRDIIDSQTRGNQAIMDKLCSLELDGVRQQLAQEQRENANLRNQIAMSTFASSQAAQTQQILANNDLQTAALEQYLAPTPRPAYVVQNPNCCQQGCGCGFGA